MTAIGKTATSPIWRRSADGTAAAERFASSDDCDDDSPLIDAELAGLLATRAIAASPMTPKFSKGAHRFPVDGFDSPTTECCSEASTSSADSAIGETPSTPPPESLYPPAHIPPRAATVSAATDAVLRVSRNRLRADQVDPLRRWSAMSVTSTGTLIPADAANCDCTSLAWAAFRSSSASARRRRRQYQAFEHSITAAAAPKDDDAYRKLSANGNSSTDSGIGSSSGSEDSQSAILSMAATKPPLARKRRRRSLSIFLNAIRRRMFEGAASRKAEKAGAQSLVAPSPTTNDLGGYSPKWRGDDTNEAGPLQRLPVESPNAQPKTFHSVDTQNSQQHITPKPTAGTLSNGRSTTFGSTRPSTTATTLLPVTTAPTTTTATTTTILQTKPLSNGAATPKPIQPFGAKTPWTPTAAPQRQTAAPKALPILQPTVAAPQPPKPKEPTIAGRLAKCPQFHYPSGRPVPRAENEAVFGRARQLFGAHGQLEYKDMGKLCQTIGLAVYAKRAVYESCLRLNGVTPEPTAIGSTPPPISLSQFTTYWQSMIAESHDEAARFIFTLASAATSERRPRSYLIRDDFIPMLMDLIHTYPGLSFLVNSTQFHSKYCEVVIVRIFWNVNRSWTGRLTAYELRRSNFLSILRLLENVVDINKMTDYFSYEHFYVAYCKFWELDTDHDMVISREDMRQHCNGAITDAIIDRVFSGAVMRTPAEVRTIRGKGPCRDQPTETIGFEDFVAFLLAEEDKKHPTSQEYWFRVLDLDGDGVLSLYEMEFFYREIEKKLTQHNFDTLSFRDVACNLFDSIAPSTRGYIALRELKKCGLAHRFFNTFVNYLKYLEQESSEGERASVKTSGDKEMSDWDQFCAMEYEILMSENDAESYADENIDVVLDDDDNDGNDDGDEDGLQKPRN